MAKVYIFSGNVRHDLKSYVKGQAVPAEIVDKMIKAGLAAPLPEPVQPVQPIEAPVVHQGPGKSAKA